MALLLTLTMVLSVSLPVFADDGQTGGGTTGQVTESASGTNTTTGGTDTTTGGTGSTDHSAGGTSGSGSSTSGSDSSTSGSGSSTSGSDSSTSGSDSSTSGTDSSTSGSDSSTSGSGSSTSGSGSSTSGSGSTTSGSGGTTSGSGTSSNAGTDDTGTDDFVGIAGTSGSLEDGISALGGAMLFSTFDPASGTGTVTTFNTLDPIIENQTVATGVEESALGLPTTLKATVNDGTTDHTDVDVPVTWTSAPAYDKEADGTTFVFTAAVDNSRAPGLTLTGAAPTINVTLDSAAPRRLDNAALTDVAVVKIDGADYTGGPINITKDKTEITMNFEFGSNAGADLSVIRTGDWARLGVISKDFPIDDLNNVKIDIYTLPEQDPFGNGQKYYVGQITFVPDPDGTGDTAIILTWSDEISHFGSLTGAFNLMSTIVRSKISDPDLTFDFDLGCAAHTGPAQRRRHRYGDDCGGDGIPNAWGGAF